MYICAVQIYMQISMVQCNWHCMCGACVTLTLYYCFVKDIGDDVKGDDMGLIGFVEGGA